MQSSLANRLNMRLGEEGVCMAKVIMIQGTMSNAGKSLLVAGLCRIMKQDGFTPAPFKSQNMALNSFVTCEGLEMGRAQVMQAEAAGIEPRVCMNPILLKPTGHMGSQVIVDGEVIGNMSARDYFSYKKSLLPHIRRAFRTLEQMADIIVIEGAGSPAEINLRENDIVNMGLAQLVDAPVLLVGDIDRGGVFAQLLGTLMLLSKEERMRVQGLIINKFRGDKSILDSGIQMLEERGGVPVIGTVPYMELLLEDEDSLTERFAGRRAGEIDIAVIRYPRISNFTDMNVLEQSPHVTLRYVSTLRELGNPDMLILPGSKNTMEDFIWLRENGFVEAVKKLAERIPVFGICGGYQMLGKQIWDPECVEAGGRLCGIGLLPVTTVLQKEKVRRQVSGCLNPLDGLLHNLSGQPYCGYEIHMGQTQGSTQGVICGAGNVYGTYVHGIFDKGKTAQALIRALAEKKGLSALDDLEEFQDYRRLKETQYDKLADVLRKYLDMEQIYAMLREARME